MSANVRETAPGERIDRVRLAQAYQTVRRATQQLCEPLEMEDYVVQSMPDASPVKWHLAHTSWFFETFILLQHDTTYRTYHPQYGFLFNSYYVSVGKRHNRPERGLLSRPTVAEVFAYRTHVDEQMLQWFERADEARLLNTAPMLELGLNHEQQHQELMVTDLKHLFGTNPMRPAYRPRPTHPAESPGELQWVEFDERLAWIGHDGSGFAYDNEQPRHQAFVKAFRLGTRPVTNGEFLAFMADGGYRTPTLWLSEGWATVEQAGWTAPLYWEEQDGRWTHYTLAGARPVEPNEPVCHVSYFEADAYARWAGARLPTEFEWEVAAKGGGTTGNFLESGLHHPAARVTRHSSGNGDHVPGMGGGHRELLQMFGDVWEWTRSQYSPYPGFRPAPGAVGEYNGKFMCNQFVLRGGSCATPQSHIRRTYRNFFPPAARWQFSGFRLAGDDS